MYVSRMHICIRPALSYGSADLTISHSATKTPLPKIPTYASYHNPPITPLISLTINNLLDNPQPRCIVVITSSSSTMGNSFDSSNIGSTIASIQEKLPAWVPFSHPPVYRYVSHNSPKQLVDFGKASLWLSVGMIFFNPIFWNFVARNGGSTRENE
jgi:hypothetical protein